VAVAIHATEQPRVELRYARTAGAARRFDESAGGGSPYATVSDLDEWFHVEKL
jgi:hypothetical protein